MTTEIVTSAIFGEAWLVEIHYYTDFDGREIDPKTEDYPRTLHGPFATEDAALAWIYAYPDGDTDIQDMYALVMNKVAP